MLFKQGRKKGRKDGRKERTKARKKHARSKGLERKRERERNKNASALQGTPRWMVSPQARAEELEREKRALIELGKNL